MTSKVFQFVHNGLGASCLPKETSLPFMMLHLGKIDENVEYMVKLDSFKTIPVNLSSERRGNQSLDCLFLELHTFIKLKYPSKKYICVLQRINTWGVM